MRDVFNICRRLHTDTGTVQLSGAATMFLVNGVKDVEKAISFACMAERTNAPLNAALMMANAIGYTRPRFVHDHRPKCPY